MALEHCRECGQWVSDEAVLCPACGVPDPSGSYARREDAQQAEKIRADREATSCAIRGCLGCLTIPVLLWLIVMLAG